MDQTIRIDTIFLKPLVGTNMKQYKKFLAVSIIGLSVAGCVTPQGRPDNTASGALTGAAVGAIIGSAARNPGAGAAVGATVGALAGGAIGHSVDQAQEIQDAQYRERVRQQEVSAPSLTIDDIISMSKAKIGDDLIISEIRNSGMAYPLKSADIVDLKRSGVSERVINVMINSPAGASFEQRAMIADTPPPAPLVEPVVVAPGPGFFWMSGTWIWLNGGWRWRHGYWRGPYHHGYGHYVYGRGWYGRHWR
jgi:hypothetical protein